MHFLDRRIKPMFSLCCFLVPDFKYHGEAGDDDDITYSVVPVVKLAIVPRRRNILGEIYVDVLSPHLKLMVKGRDPPGIFDVDMQQGRSGHQPAYRRIEEHRRYRYGMFYIHGSHSVIGYEDEINRKMK